MTLRVRLSLWYGTLSALAVSLVALVGYSASVQDRYLTLDRVLVVSARLVKSGLDDQGRSYVLRANTLGPARDGIVVVLRVYSSGGTLLDRSPSDPGLPPTEPEAPLSSPAPPAYLRLLPFALARDGLPPEAGSAFGTLTVGGQRWRRYVVTVNWNGQRFGYVEALTPLGRADEESGDLARLLLHLAIGTVVAVLVVSWLLAGSALRPIDRLTRTARAIAHSRDLTRRVRTSERRDELGRLAATFNEMLTSLEGAWQSQQRFVADASHELRAPLTVMRGNLELLRRHPLISLPEREDMLTDIEREAARLTRLVEDLLLLAESEAGTTLNRRPVDLQAVASEALRDARLLARGHRLMLDAPPQPLHVLGDVDRLKQLLLILLDNAMKYSPPGSAVTVTLRDRAGGPALDVHDQGPGIALESLAHIFDRFYRADTARTPGTGGSGLGLAIARWIAEQHGANVEVSRTGPGGTTFTVTFPSSPTSVPDVPVAAAQG